MKRSALRAAFLIAALVTGCGGSGSTISAPVSKAAPAAATVPVNVSIQIPRGGSLSVRRKQYISPATQSISASAQPVSGGVIVVATANCPSPQTDCSVQVAAQVGLNIFTIRLYDQPNGTGDVLSTGSTTLQVQAGILNDVQMVFDGVPASMTVLVTPSTIARGVAAVGDVEVVIYDAAGHIMVGPGLLTTPISLSINDSTGSVTLGATQITDPSQPVVTYNYNGGTASSAIVTITAQASGLANATGTLAFSIGPPTPSPSPTPSPPPSPTPTPTPTPSPTPTGATPTPVPTASPTPTPAPTRTPEPTPTPSYVLACNVTISQPQPATQSCDISPVQFKAPDGPATMVFTFSNVQGTLRSGLYGLVGDSVDWVLTSDNSRTVTITVAGGTKPGYATLVVQDAGGGYRSIQVSGS